jgi:hypothetical protein
MMVLLAGGGFYRYDTMGRKKGGLFPNILSHMPAFVFRPPCAPKVFALQAKTLLRYPLIKSGLRVAYIQGF